MVWTVVAINTNTERAEAEVFDLSPDTVAAMMEATRELPGRTIVAMVRGHHIAGTHLPESVLSLRHTRK